MTQVFLRRRALAAASLLLLGLSLWPMAPSVRSSPPAGNTLTYSGRATVFRATVGTTTTIVGDTGPLPSSGGALESLLLTVNVDWLLTANVAHAATTGQGNRSRSEASVANVVVTVGGERIAAEFIMARAEARCSPGPSFSGSSEIAGLTVNGRSIAATGAPNQMVTLSQDLTVIINEQTSTGAGDITVNALHVYISDYVTGGIVAEIVVASAHADVTCGDSPQPCGEEFVTGGGWITGTPSGAKGNFGVGGGIKNGAFWGHLTYIDHGPNGPKVKGTGVTAYMVTGPSPTSRHIEGTAEINGAGDFTYQVDVADNGEPGRSDTFTLRLSNGYGAVYMASGMLAGGNIQLHKPCGS